MYLTLNSSGAKVGETRYTAWGETRHATGAMGTQRLYTGQLRDSETGLYYYNARYYDPVLHRFTQADTLVPDPANPQSLNRYSYTLNNPVRYTDPSGHDVMIIGGAGSNAWTDPEDWAIWMMEYKGWSYDEWRTQFYDRWMSANDIGKEGIMADTGIYIFNWQACGCGNGEAEASRNATMDWAVGALHKQISTMTDVTLIGHSKGGNLVLNYFATGWNAFNPNIKAGIMLDAPTKYTPSGFHDRTYGSRLVVDSAIRAYANTQVAVLPPETRNGIARAPIWNIYNPLDPVNHFHYGHVEGALNVSPIVIGLDWHSRHDAWASLILYPRLGDNNAAGY